VLAARRTPSNRTTIGELLEAAQARLDRVEPQQAREEAANGALLIDTRPANVREATGVIPGSFHVPDSVLFWRLDDTSGYHDERFSDRSRRVILVCADGYSSSLAAATLRDLGFDRATDLVGGFNAWVAAGLPVERASENRGG
jgi:rhodanese-related sulfurtransferase